MEDVRAEEQDNSDYIDLMAKEKDYYWYNISDTVFERDQTTLIVCQRSKRDK